MAESKSKKKQVVASSPEVVDVKEFVSVTKSDLKDPKKKDKIKQIVLYSLQEAFKQDSFAGKMATGKKPADLLKMAEFRSLVMSMVEG